MKKYTLIFAASLFCMASILSLSSASTALAAKKKTVSITFSKSTDTMENGTSFSFRAKVKNAKASSVVWKSSHPKIISINKKTGKASAKKIGKATITARTGKKLVRLTVTVSPSAADLKKANNTWDNLKNGIFTSVSSTAASNTAGSQSNVIYREYSCLDSKKSITCFQTVENSYFSYINNNIKYTLDYIKGDVAAEEFSEKTEGNNNFMLYSNAELLSAAINSDRSYTLIYMADIAKMTEEEKNSVGLKSGTCVMTIQVEPKHLLVQSYQTTNYSSDGVTAATISGSFSYNTENELILPEEIKTTAGIEETTE